MGYSNQKAEKINFKSFWSYIDFIKVLKKTENSKYLSKYWISGPEIRVDKKLHNKKNKDKKMITTF